ncbi:MAG: ATPase [Elusimicrobia bacterium RIFOXYB2_FULL_48_7]|nr:MAG: ATPase [Elusimicrobia bacterium RIFOXYB2_FULL_48_7]
MESLIPRLFTPPKQSFFLFGPRGTGKSTWLKQNMPDALWIDLLEADEFRSYSARPERLKELVLAKSGKKTVVIDEIQKVPGLLSVVHSLIEQKLGLRFILTGSSSRKLKKTGADLLAGRVIKQTLHPFMAIELNKKFNLVSALKQGLLPLVFSSVNPEAVLRTYASLYVREEVQMEGLVRNIGNFSRFLEAISFSHGALLNNSNVARECEVERKVVEAYINILEDLLLAFRIPIFSKKAKRATTTHPKFYYFDSGVYRSLRPAGPLDRPEEIEGAALEGLVAQHLIAWNSYRCEKNKVYFWRTLAGSEVDFVVYGEDVFWAIEVKNSSKVRPEDIRSLESFKSEYPQCRAFLLYRGKEHLKKGNVYCIPCDEFLLNLNPEKTSVTQ